MPMTQWEFKMVPCLAEKNASAKCQNAYRQNAKTHDQHLLVMSFADLQ